VGEATLVVKAFFDSRCLRFVILMMMKVRIMGNGVVAALDDVNDIDGSVNK